jgi:hypothetical protein
MFHSHAVLTVALVPGAPVLTRKGFEERLSRSFQTAVQVAELLAAPAAARRFEEYSTVLRGRADVLRKEMASDDHVGALVAAELVQLATGPEQILALRSGASSRVLAVLDNALLRWPGTLIERIRNKKVPMRRRMEWARVLSEGLWIRERYELARRASKDLTNRVAQLAIENLGTELIYPLLRGVVSIGDHLKADQAALARDVYPALRVLSEAYPAAEPSDQYHIAEVLQQIGGEPYRKLLPEAGPFLTLIEPAPDLADSMASGELRVRCSFRNQLTTRSELTIVLKAQGELEIELPVESELSELTNNFGSGWEIGASIPQRVSPGRYRVFLRARQGKRRVGDGLGFEINLPRR